MRPWRKEGRCLRASELNLTSEQIKGLQHLQQSYLQETQTLRAQLIAKRIELRELLTNSSSRMEIIRMKYMELAEAQIRMEEKTIDYLIKIRHLLTPEQLLLWCPEEEFPMPHKTMPGHRPFKPMPPMKIPPPEE
ncbi:MAG: periplasmic heavy metal sensor [Desulfobacterota bacterium]|nr:periplasmic heavy metal sensor [Thermodesulfobacteriota bacterium]